jgi:hypothetical protein
MTKIDHYDTMWAKFQAGQITHEEWMQYCTKVLGEILDQPEIREVMKRLKHR